MPCQALLRVALTCCLPVLEEAVQHLPISTISGGGASSRTRLLIELNAAYLSAGRLEDASAGALQAHCHRGLGTHYRQTGQVAQARAALSTAIDLYRDMEMTFWLPQAEATLAELGGR